MGFLVFLSLSTFVAVPSVEECREAIEKHDAMVQGIHSIYVKVETDVLLPKNKTPELMRASESWKQGVREKTVQRTYRAFGKDGFEDHTRVHKDGVIRAQAWSERILKEMDGWDTHSELDLPLDIAKDQSLFRRLKGEISDRDPARRTSFDWGMLFLEFGPGIKLSEVAREAVIEPLESTSDDRVRFRIAASPHSQCVGMDFELDKQHGYMVAKMGIGPTTNVVDEFKTFEDSITLPMHITTVIPGLATMTSRVVDVRVNKPIADEDLDFNFPEGARVDLSSTLEIAIWGKDNKPERLFKTDGEFADFLKDRMSDSKTVGTPATPLQGTSQFSVILWGNTALVAVIVLLLWLRRRTRG